MKDKKARASIEDLTTKVDKLRKEAEATKHYATIQAQRSRLTKRGWKHRVEKVTRSRQVYGYYPWDRHMEDYIADEEMWVPPRRAAKLLAEKSYTFNRAVEIDKDLS